MFYNIGWVLLVQCFVQNVCLSFYLVESSSNSYCDREVSEGLAMGYMSGFLDRC